MLPTEEALNSLGSERDFFPPPTLPPPACGRGGQEGTLVQVWLLASKRVQGLVEPQALSCRFQLINNQVRE